MKQLGFLVNPIAGMGGSVGLKGTDGLYEESVRRGAVPHAPQRAAEALVRLLPLCSELEILSARHMGYELARELGFAVREICPVESAKTTREDLIRCARAMDHAALLVFAGGDGTARDIAEAVGLTIPAVGVPAGVKIHSPVYAVSPAAAGALALEYLRNGGEMAETEVVDIDEAAYRNDVVSTRLYGYLAVPQLRRYLQEKKAPSPASEKQAQFFIAEEMAGRMEPGVSYLVGPGSTLRTLFEFLHLPKTLLGFDLICNKRLVRADVSEREILKHLDQGCHTELILTPTGGQGYLLGRGNQQCSPAVLHRIGKEGIHILATREKLFSLRGRPLYVDTNDIALNRQLSGYYRAIIGWHEEQVCRVSFPAYGED